VIPAIVLAPFLAWLALAGGCGKGPVKFELSDVSGALPDLEFSLYDAGGVARSAAGYRGRVVLLYFGYTNCPDVCPTTLQRLAQALAKLGDRAARARVLFVTVDPERDTAARLQAYARAFGPGVEGLRAEGKPLQDLEKRYHVVAEREGGGADYSVGHTSAVYIFDPSGRARLVATGADAADVIAHDVALLIDGR